MNEQIYINFGHGDDDGGDKCVVCAYVYMYARVFFSNGILDFPYVIIGSLHTHFR
jgi:hypothetical protein